MRIGLRLFWAFLCGMFCSNLCAAEYVFTGSGSFTNPANWQNGAIPPVYSGANDIIRIVGHAIVSEGCDVRQQEYVCDENFGGSSGTLIIEHGATLDLRNSTQFENHGTLIVYGTLINTTTVELYDTGDVTIWGTLINRFVMSNQGIFTVENGGRVENESSAWALSEDIDLIGTLIVKNGGVINFGPVKNLRLGNNYISEGALTGDVTVPGNLENGGVLAPGNSPGKYVVKGDYIAASTAVHDFEVGGTSDGLYDLLEVAGRAAISGKLNVTLIDGFSSNDDHSIQIIKGNIQGSFADVTLPNGYQLVYLNNAVVLQRLTVTPVTFVSLSVKKYNTGIKLSWEVAGEVDVKEYIVERSHDGINFSMVGKVAAIGSNRYQHQDENHGSGGYYRVKSVDLDGTTKYSVVVTVSPSAQQAPISLYPLPAQSFVIVQHGKLANKAILSVLTTDGKLIRALRTEPFAQNTRIDLSNLPAGLYLIQLNDGGWVYSVKLVKR